MKVFCVAFLIVMLGCGGNELPRVESIKLSQRQSFRESSLIGTSVDDFFVVVFPKDFTKSEWKQIFLWTNQLSSNRARLRRIAGLMDEETQRIRADLLGQNAEILIELGDRSAMILYWSNVDENCKVNESLKIECSPLHGENPLSGAVDGKLPVNRLPLEWRVSNPTDSVKANHLFFSLEMPEQYQLHFKLGIESQGEDGYFFKGLGEVKFWNKESVYPFAYAEIFFKALNSDSRLSEKRPFFPH